MGGLNHNFEKPWRNQGRTPYNTVTALSLCLDAQNELRRSGFV